MIGRIWRGNTTSSNADGLSWTRFVKMPLAKSNRCQCQCAGYPHHPRRFQAANRVIVVQAIELWWRSLYQTRRTIRG